MKLVALHGMSMNGSVMRSRLDFVQRALPALEIVAPDAPHVCPDETVERLYAVWKEPRLEPPYLRWFDASDDGHEYRGWEATRDFLRTRVAAGPIGLIGFSQGAILATAIAALAAHGEMPAVRFAILIAGRTPRADVLQPYLQQPIALPSLHVWGEKDNLVGDSSRLLVDSFVPMQREVATWPGQHSIPKSGPASDAIVAFIARHAS
jgi:pimeloyl-ACP methyl ester carboxylesterase